MMPFLLPSLQLRAANFLHIAFSRFAVPLLAYIYQERVSDFAHVRRASRLLLHFCEESVTRMASIAAAGGGAPPAPSAQETKNPLDMYEVVQTIGKGSFGTVSKIRRKADGRVRPGAPIANWFRGGEGKNDPSSFAGGKVSLVAALHHAAHSSQPHAPSFRAYFALCFTCRSWFGRS
jgi:hypothetical protein